MLLQQAILILLSVTLIAVLRRRGGAGPLSFLLAVMWLCIAVLGIVAAVLLPNVGLVGSKLGLLPAAILAGSASLILGVIALVLSFRVSRLEERQRDFAEAVGRSTLEPAVPAPRDAASTLVIVPALNEAPSIGGVVRGLISAGFPVLVVDDGSSDSTAAVARSAGASVMSLPLNLGVGGALRAGLRVSVSAGFRQVIQCDADGQHPIDAVLALAESQHRSPVDLLIGSRFVDPASRRRESTVRFVATLMLSRIASRAAGSRITDATSGLRAIRSPLLEELALTMPSHYLGDTFEVNVMAGRSGYRIRELAVDMLPRAHGSSTASTSDAVRLTVRGILVVLLRLPNHELRPRLTRPSAT